MLPTPKDACATYLPCCPTPQTIVATYLGNAGHRVGLVLHHGVGVLSSPALALNVLWTRAQKTEPSAISKNDNAMP